MAGLPDHKFDLSIFGEVEDGELFDNRVVLNKMTVRASNIQISGYPHLDEASSYTFPIYFEVPGLKYHYIVSAWTSQVEIWVCRGASSGRLGSNRFDTLSICSPRNQSELLEVIETIARDFEDLVDQQAIA